MGKAEIRIVAEEQVCVQGGEAFTCFVLVVDGRRVFSTEDETYLRASGTMFRGEYDVTLVLDCDRNSAEAPELGPLLDLDIPSPLYVRRLGDTVSFQSGAEHERVTHLEAPLASWLAAVDEL